jgi:hypothetical protein
VATFVQTIFAQPDHLPATAQPEQVAGGLSTWFR